MTARAPRDIWWRRLPKLAEIRKAVAAAGSAATVATAAGLLTGDLAVWVTGGIATAAAFLATYASKANEPTLRQPGRGATRTGPTPDRGSVDAGMVLLVVILVVVLILLFHGRIR